MKVIFCTPSLGGPTKPYIAAMEASIPLIVEAGWTEGYAQEIGCPYISQARNVMLRRALDAGADVIVFIDYDLSWRPGDLLELLRTEGDVVAGTYRFRQQAERYMGTWYTGPNGTPLCRPDGCIAAEFVPAGMLKVTASAVSRFGWKYPELLYGKSYAPHIDLFNHGAHQNIWFGEDYAFCRRWREMGEQVWLLPDMEIAHHQGETPYPGNLHRWLMRQPGGCEDPAREVIARAKQQQADDYIDELVKHGSIGL